MSLALAKSERRAWRVATVALLLTVASLGSLVALAPLKSAVPYLVELDRVSGESQVVPVVTPKLLVTNDVLARHWAVEYVRSRERYNWDLLQFDYDTVLRFSDESVARQYASQFEGTGAIDRELGATTELRVNIISVTLPPGERGKAVVRFERSITKRDSPTADSTARFIATIAYRYSPSPITQERDLIENPLGFHVTSYLVDRELTDSGSAIGATSAGPGK